MLLVYRFPESDLVEKQLRIVSVDHVLDSTVTGETVITLNRRSSNYAHSIFILHSSPYSLFSSPFLSCSSIPLTSPSARLHSFHPFIPSHSSFLLCSFPLHTSTIHLFTPLQVHVPIITWTSYSFPLPPLITSIPDRLSLTLLSLS